MDILRGALGIVVIIFLLFLFSANRKRINWKLVLSALGIQIILGVLVLKVEWVGYFFSILSSGFIYVTDFTEAGSAVVFGGLMDVENVGYIFAVKVLPTIIFFSALSSILYYLGILQKVIYGLAWGLSKLMRLSGAESLAAAANVFIGQTEAPLIIKPYLNKMTKSELMCLMVGGMATIAGGVLAAYVGFLGGDDPDSKADFALHLLTASIMSAPAAILAAKMLYPETEEVSEDIEVPKEQLGDNLLDAISRGTSDGIKLAVNVAGMLIVFTALMFMLNQILLGIGGMIPYGDGTLNDSIQAASNNLFSGLTLDYLLGKVFAPIAWLLGICWDDAALAGQLLGQKTILNEFIAYANMPAVAENFTEYKSKIIVTYALCGFANFASIGIQIGGIGAIAPERRKTLSQFGIKALIGGTAACFLTAAIAGMLVDNTPPPPPPPPPAPEVHKTMINLDSFGMNATMDTVVLSQDTVIIASENDTIVLLPAVQQ